MTNDVFLNGIPHAVQTSELTKNAINPRNNFIDHPKNELGDVSQEFPKHEQDSIEAAKTEVEEENLKTDEPSYPAIQDSFDAHGFVVVPENHITKNFQKLSPVEAIDNEVFHESLHKIEDRIQNLRKKHPTKNIQHLERNTVQSSRRGSGDVHRFADNMQKLNQTSFTENRQKIDEKTMEANFQKLPRTGGRRDNILYKEKKNIQANYQQADSLNISRESATMGDTSAPDARSELKSDPSLRDSQMPVPSVSRNQSVENELTARVRRMREEIGKVNQSLTDFEGDQ